MSDDAPFHAPHLLLQLILDGDVRVGTEGLPLRNLLSLIDLTKHTQEDVRDWATFVLSQTELNTPLVRNALIAAAEDEWADVRAEALEGLAMRAPDTACALVERELRSGFISVPLFKAASYVGSPLLLDALEYALQGEDLDNPDRIVMEGLVALEACKASAPKPAEVEFEFTQ